MSVVWLRRDTLDAHTLGHSCVELARHRARQVIVCVIGHLRRGVAMLLFHKEVISWLEHHGVGDGWVLRATS